MPKLGSGAYPTATSLDAQDHILGFVDGATSEIPGSVAKAFTQPTGVIDVNDHTTVAESVQNACENTTGWTTTSSQAAPSTSTLRTQGSFAVKVVPYMTTAQPLASGYYTFSSPVAIGDNTHFAIDLLVDLDGPSGVYAFDDIVWVIADSTALSGNTQTVTIPNVGYGIWQTLRFPLTGLTQIKSIGYQALRVQSGAATARAPMWVDNMRFLARTKLDNALIDSTVKGVIVGDYDTSTQTPPYIPSGKSFIDFATGTFANQNGVIYLEGNYVDSTGESDCTTRLAQVINSAPAGSIVRAKAGGQYRLDRRLSISGRRDVTLDFTDATFFHYEPTTKTTDWFIEILGCDRLKVKGGTYLGWGKRPYSASSMTTVAGTPTDNGTSKELNALDEEVREPAVAYWLVGPHYARHLPQQLGLPQDEFGPRYYFQYTLSDTAQVANDCVIRIYEDWSDHPDYGDLLQTTTLTLTSTPTVYTIEYIPTNPHPRSRLKVQVKKATATANTITIASPSPWGKSEYNATYDVASGFRIERSTNTELTDMWIEGFAGDAVQISDPNVEGLYLRNVTSRCCSRQGMSFNQGRDITIEDCDIYATGRSGVDFEPYTSTWVTKNVILHNMRLFDIVNYGFAMENWARNLNYVIDGVDFYNCRLGNISGGVRGGTLRNWRSWEFTGTEDYSFFGADMLIENIWAVSKIRCYVTTSAYDDGSGPVTYTPTGNLLRNLHCTTDGQATKVFLNTGYILDGASFNLGTQSSFTNTTDTFGPVEVVDDDYTNIRLGNYYSQLSNTFKGPVASAPVWHPDGRNNFDDPTYNMRSLSGTTTKGNNLRAVNVAVTQTATSLAVTFPTRNNGSLVATTNYTLTATTGGALTPSATYYYRIAPRTRFSGPSTYGSQLSVTLGSTQNAVIVKLKNLISVVNSRMIEGATVLRGATSGGPYTSRFDLVPTGLAGMISLATDLIDTGPTLTGGGIGYADSRAEQSGSWTATVDESGYEPDATYGVQVTPSWATTVYVTAKTTAGFTINFGTAAPAGATCDWFLIR